MKNNSMITQSKSTIKNLSLWAVVVAGVLMIPLLTNSAWTKGDYIFAGIVLFSLATIYELVTRNMSNNMYRLAVGIGLLGVIVLIIGWAATGP